MAATPVRFVCSTLLPSDPPALLSGVLDDAANLLTLTFDQEIQPGSIGANHLRVDGVGSTFKASKAGVFTGGTSADISVLNQLGGTSGSPRISWQTPTTPFLGFGGLPVPVFTDFPITVI